MKKYLFVLLTIMLVSCGPDHTKMNEGFAVENMTVIEFEYNKHDYIMFSRYGNTRQTGIVHNPECHCKEE